MTAILICGTTVFISCSKNDDPVDPTDNLAEKIIGKWLMEKTDGLSFPTDEKSVFTFLSDTKAYMSASIHTDESESAWDVPTEFDVSINGKTVTLVDSIDEHRVRVLELNVTSINDKEMQANWKIIRFIDGEKEASGVGTSVAQSHWQTARQNQINSLKNYWLAYYHLRRLTLYDYQRHQTISYQK